MHSKQKSEMAAIAGAHEVPHEMYHITYIQHTRRKQCSLKNKQHTSHRAHAEIILFHL